jgi:hypothetical protein
MSDRCIPSALVSLAAIDRLAACVVAVLAAAAGYYTYFGASAIEPNGDWMTKAGCALLALSIAAGIYTFWRALHSLVPLLSARGRLLASPIIVLAVLFVIGVSTFFNLTGMIGFEAVRHQMEVITVALGDGFAFARNQAQQGLEGATALRLNLAKFQQMAVAERDRGRTSGGTPGAGAVAGMLEQVATVMGAAVQDADAKAALAEALSRDAETGLDAMRKLVADPDLSLQVKSARFATETEGLRIKLLRLSRIEIVTTVRQAVAAARETVKPALSAKKAVAEQQARAIQDLDRQLGQLESLNLVAAQAPPAAMLGQPVPAITVYTAVLMSVSSYLPAAMAALFIDLLPLPLLLLKMIGHTDVAGNGKDIAGRYTVKELLEMRELMERTGLEVPARRVAWGDVIPPPWQHGGRRSPALRVIPDDFN